MCERNFNRRFLQMASLAAGLHARGAGREQVGTVRGRLKLKAKSSMLQAVQTAC